MDFIAMDHLHSLFRFFHRPIFYTFDFASLSVSLLLAFLLPFFFFFLLRFFFPSFFSFSGLTSSRTRTQLPPGSFGLPLIGETLQFAFQGTCPIGTPPPFHFTRFQRYGKVFKTHLMGRPALMSMDPNLNKRLLSSEGLLVKTFFPSFITRITGPWLTVRGARHRRLRDIVVPQLSSVAIQKHHLVEFQERTLSVMRRWSTCTGMIDAKHEIEHLIFTHMAAFLISLEPTHPFVPTLIHDFALLSNGFSCVPLDIPGTGYNKVLKARRRILDFLGQTLQQRRKQERNRSVDFMDTLMNATDESGKAFNDEDILELLFFMIHGGFETTSILFTNIMKFLSENQHVVEELRMEHLSIRQGKKNKDELLTWEDYKQMEFTQQVLKETLRLGSIAHYVVREACQDISYDDMIIPKGWMVFLHFVMVHLNPDYFPNPLKFDPWRWQADNNDSRSYESHLTPFGGGIRSCPGSSLTKFEASIFIHYLVINYRWERVMDKEEQCDIVSNLSLPTLKKGMRIRVETLT